MLNLGPYLRFGVFDLASHAPDQTLFSVLFIVAGTRGNRPNHLATLMLRALVHAGVTGIAADVSFLAMPQLIDLSHVRHIRRGAHQAAHQAGFGIDADVRFHSKIVLVSFLGLMHFGVAFAVLVLGRTRRVNNRRIDHRALAQYQSTVAQIAIDDLQNSAGRLMLFQQPAEVEDRGFIGNSIQMQTRELAQDRRFIQ